MWRLFALVAMLAWGLEDVLIKVNAEREGDLFSFKMAACVMPLVILIDIFATMNSESGLPLLELLLSNTTVWLAMRMEIYVTGMKKAYLRKYDGMCANG